MTQQQTPPRYKRESWGCFLYITAEWTPPSRQTRVGGANPSHSHKPHPRYKHESAGPFSFFSHSFFLYTRLFLYIHILFFIRVLFLMYKFFFLCTHSFFMHAFIFLSTCSHLPVLFSIPETGKWAQMTFRVVWVHVSIFIYLFII